MKISIVSFIGAFIFLSNPCYAQSGAAKSSPTAYEKECEALARKGFRSASDKLKAIFDFQWAYTMSEYPEYATYVGLEKGQDRWTDSSRAAIDRRKRELECTAKLAGSVDRAKLGSDADRLNLDVFRYSVERSLAGNRFPDELLAIGSMEGVQLELPSALESMRKTKVADVENILARLDRAPDSIRQNELLLREGLEKGITAPKASLGGVVASFDTLLTNDKEKNGLYAPFKSLPSTIPAAEASKLQARAWEIIKAKVQPELTRFKTFLAKEYIPKARETLGLTALPDGKAWYDHRILRNTTTSMTASQIHDLGLKETERIKAEMEKTMRAAGWKKDLPSFFQHLRTNSRFYWKTKEEFLAGYRDIAKRADAEMPKHFRALPRLPYGVKAAPEHAEKTMSAAYYEGGSLEAGRPAWFVANAYNLKGRPKWEMESLALHEGVPGHHHQIAIAQEMPSAPDFRRYMHFTAFSEGWALYAETLGYEMDFYKDPYSKMGQLSSEMWRACRMVVDTGLHSLGWSREKAVQFMVDRIPKTRSEMEVEVDRYIGWPGQAVSYKVGQLKIAEFRSRARAALGEGMDLRAFHDMILSDGALPLDMIDAKVNAWIDAQKKKPTRG